MKTKHEDNHPVIGRPAKNVVPPIKDTPKRVACSIMQCPPKKDWEYLKNQS